MRKINFTLAAIMLIATLSACGNSKKSEKKQEAKTQVSETKTFSPEFLAKMDGYIENICELGELPMTINANTESIKLSAEEKKVKPDYLLPLEKVNTLTDSSEKFAVLFTFLVDMQVAELYDMPTDGYNGAISKLAADLNSPMINRLLENGMKGENLIESLKKEALENNDSKNAFWYAYSCAMTETIYIMTQNIEKFSMGMTDQQAFEISERFKKICEATEILIIESPDMMPLYTAMTPLYNINAKNLAELKVQLANMESEIGQVRNQLIGE